MKLSPGSTYYGRFYTTDPSTNAAANATGTPALTVYRNGVDTGLTVTPTSDGTGEYKFSFTVNAGWSPDDVVRVKATATVSGITRPATVGEFTVDASVAANNALLSDGTNGLGAIKAGQTNGTVKLDPAYNAAKTAAQAGDAMNLAGNAITAAKVAAGALNGKGDWNTVAPDNAGIAAVKAKTDNLPASPAATSDIPSATANGNAAATAILATPANKLTTDNTGKVTSTNGGLTDQQTRDAMKLAPSAGEAAAGSVDAKLNALVNVGSGSVAVNHNTGGADNLRAVDGNGNGVACTVYAYLSSEYGTDPLTATVRGESVTGADGRWLRNMMLNPGSYVFAFAADGYALGTVTQSV